MEQTLELLLGDFRSKTKEYNRLFFVGLFFALATHFYVVEPYFLFKQQQAVLKVSSASIQQSVKELYVQENELLATQKNLRAGLARIRKQVNSFPDLLRDSLPDIRAALANRSNNQLIRRGGPAEHPNTPYMQQQAPNISVASIIIPDHITRFSPAVRWYIDEWFKKLLVDLDQSVVNPLKQLAQGEEIAGAEQLDKLGRKAVQQVHNHISGINPNFWRTYGGRGGKQDVAGQIRKNIEQAFYPLETKVEQVLLLTKKLRLQQSAQLKELEKKLAITKKQITELSNRLKTLESPFGPIPLGLTDLIKVFPFIMAAMLIILAVRLNQSLRLRSIIGEIFNHDHRMLTVPLQEYLLGGWLFPTASRKQPLILLGAWFITVITLSCRAAWLIGWTSRLFETQTDHTFINQSIYKFCFTAVLILVVLASFRGLKNLYLTPIIKFDAQNHNIS